MAPADGGLVSLAHPPPDTSREALQRELDDAIIRTAGSRRRDYALSVVHVSPSDHSRVQSSLLASSIIVAQTGLGVLDRLPVELLLQALRHMDMQALFNLRRVNLRARQMVDSLKEYRAVVSHGLTAYCALLRMRLAAHVTLLDFYRVLCAQDCAFCGKFGGFVFLPSWIRCCFECIEEDPETRMVTVAEARRLFRLSRAEVGRQRACQTMPGIYSTGLYSTDKSYQRGRLRLVPYFPAMKEFGDRLETGVPRSRHRPFWEPAHNFMSSCELPYYDPQTRAVEYGISCAGCEARAIEQHPGQASRPADAPWDGVFSRDNFLKHFRTCRQAQKLWESSPEAALEAIIKRDDYYN
ncbi:hypothetical protein BBK36DRAFT_1125562 [Trichoderma citrinoviride]|uniref:F-box domain-containing protein n=1 Tax=Trichoderma citrinoviride TaxID=58853 RepID=A0A2T4B3T6_9HYPO|nr:hypothetical protein BBK36DRAFT_1125562 [Trichoderma citrinoviride]PTB63861.1 hypothetical protein BBK36DRAFT_1125562 [Trichoderma citrinoviride]